MLLTVLILIAVAGFASLAVAYWRSPVETDRKVGHSPTKYHQIMAGRYVSFAAFAALCLWWEDALLTSAVFAIFALTALIDFTTYHFAADKAGDPIPHVYAFVLACIAAVIAFYAAPGERA